MHRLPPGSRRVAHLADRRSGENVAEAATDAAGDRVELVFESEVSGVEVGLVLAEQRTLHFGVAGSVEQGLVVGPGVSGLIRVTSLTPWVYCHRVASAVSRAHTAGSVCGPARHRPPLPPQPAVAPGLTRSP